MLFRCLLACLVFNEKSNATFIFVFLYVTSFSLDSGFLFVIDFEKFDHDVPGVLFMLPMLEICWTFWICDLIVFIEFGIFLAIISSNFLPFSPRASTSGTQWSLGLAYIYIFFVSPHPTHSSLKDLNSTPGVESMPLAVKAPRPNC